MQQFFWMMLVMIISHAAGQVPYLTRNQACCKGKVSPFKESYPSCCGSTAYDYNTQLCCGDDNVLSKTGSDGVALTCCGSKAVPDDPSKLCCSGELVDRPKSANNFEYFSCCGTKPFSPSKQACCGETLVDICNGGTGCCGDKPFNSRTQICCMDVIHDLKKGSDDGNTCSNGYPYGPSYYTPGISCCGDQMFDQSKQLCCYETDKPQVIPLPEGTTCPYSYTCCGGKAVLANQQCCNGKVYNPPTVEIIQNYKISPYQAYYGPLTDGTAYLTQVGYCCNNGGIVQDPDKETCCSDGTVIPVDSPNQGCCGLRSYDYNSQVCCGTKVYDQTQNYQITCCGDEPYNYDTHFCCGSKILDKNDTQDNCCVDWSKTP